MTKARDIPEPSGRPATLTEPTGGPRGEAPDAPERSIEVDPDQKSAPNPAPKGRSANG